MRLGVIDVGSNTVHLLVVDAHQGAHPWPVSSVKSTLRLAERIGPDGTLDAAGADQLVEAVREAKAEADRIGTDDLLAFATSAVRDATNVSAVLGRVHAEAGVDLQVLSGADEARLTFFAVRRWFGWSAGRLLVLDIGGGSLEVAHGIDESPDLALSVPLGAGRLTREWLTADPPPAEELAALTEYVRKTLDGLAEQLGDVRPDRAVATSKTFRSLARLSGAAPSGAGVWTPRTLTRTGLHQVLGFVRRIPSAGLAELDGVSPARAHQLLAGGVVAEQTLRRLDLSRVDICPWALREGVILRRLDWLHGA
ncbi:MAG TPA: Ppx/GppA phosphatase family protein [Actinocatenispora sp.]